MPEETGRREGKPCAQRHTAPECGTEFAPRSLGAKTQASKRVQPGQRSCQASEEETGQGWWGLAAEIVLFGVFDNFPNYREFYKKQSSKYNNKSSKSSGLCDNLYDFGACYLDSLSINFLTYEVWGPNPTLAGVFGG